MRGLLITFVILLSSLFSTNAKADDWGCQVMLCLANPRGPTAVAECVPPIERLWASLRKLHPDPFPKCVLSNGSTSSNDVAQETTNFYPLCPQGLSPLPYGVYVNVGGTYVQGFGDGRNMSGDNLPPMACVGQQISSTYQYIGDENNGDNGSNQRQIIINEYAQIQFISPTGSGRAVDVFIGGQLVNRVQY